MIELQCLTGMRPGEVTAMRACELDTTGRVWVYRPSEHKMAYRDRVRKVYVGPAAQTILKPWLKTDLSAYLFSPAEARAERFAAMRANRKSKVQPSQKSRKTPAPKRRPGDRYTTRTYYHAILYGCARAYPHPVISKIKRKKRTAEQKAELNEWNRSHAWHPNQLRHNAGTRIRKEFGLDVARIILGHTSPVVTEVYAEVDQERALAVVGKIG
jgi:integrase